MDRAYLLPVIETIQAAWQKVKGSKATLWGAYGWIILVAFVFGFTIGILDALNNSGLNILSAILKPLISLGTLILSIGIVRLGIRRALDQPIRASMVFYPLTKGGLILKLIGCWILYVLILLPFILITFFAVSFEFSDLTNASTLGMLVSGFAAGFSFVICLYLIVRTRLGWAFILDKELGPWQAIKASFKVTRCNFWQLLALYFLNALIVSASILPLGLGLIWSLPYVLINYGVVYRKLVEGQGWIEENRA